MSNYFTMYYYKIVGVAVLPSLPAITATSYYKIVGVAVLSFRLSLLLPTPSGPKYLQQIFSFFCATHVGHVGFVPELGWRFRSIIL